VELAGNDNQEVRSLIIADGGQLFSEDVQYPDDETDVL